MAEMCLGRSDPGDVREWMEEVTTLDKGHRDRILKSRTFRETSGESSFSGNKDPARYQYD
jgi:hypothetical protein